MPSRTRGPEDTGTAPSLARRGWEPRRAGATLLVLVTALAASYLSIYTTLGPIAAGQNPATYQREILVYIFSVGFLVAIGTSVVLHLRRLLQSDQTFSLLEFLLSGILFVMVPLMFILSVVVGLTVAMLWFGPMRFLGVPLASVLGDRFTYALITFFMVASGMGWGIALGSVRFLNQ